MRDRELKSAVVAALRPTVTPTSTPPSPGSPTLAPDFCALSHLTRQTSPADLRRLLRWLDQSGLALYLIHQLQQHDALDAIPVAFREALELRLASNRDRTLDLLGEFRRINDAFNAHGVRFCALKGFSLIPDFCPVPDLRHQTDFDFLVSPECGENAQHVLESYGYATDQSSSPGASEVTFATPLGHIPSAHDDIYAPPRHREVDLLISLSLREHGVAIDAPSDCLRRVQPMTLHSITFPALSLDDRFTLQVTHAFRHWLGSWVRLSWLLEITRFMDLHHDDEDLWGSVISRAGHNPILRNAFGLILSLTRALFRRPIPSRLHAWCLRPLPNRIALWVGEFGQRWAVSGLDGAKLTLFVHREFVEDPATWTPYLVARIFPLGRQSSIGKVPKVRPGARIKARLFQWLHSMRRAVFHLRELVSLPLEAIRWKRAIRSIQKQRTLVSATSEEIDSHTDATSGSALASVARFRN